MSQWNAADMASAWLRAAEARNRMMASATERMFALAGVAAGARVLDVGTGTGDTAIMLAHRVGPAGEVLATDAAAAMVSAAADAARNAGLPNVKTRAMDLRDAFGDIGVFDAAVARHVLMFVGDVRAALARVRHVLRSGGRFAATVWAELEKNPFHAIPIRAVEERGAMPTPAPELVRAFSLSDPAALARAFEEAGFVSVTVEPAPGAREFAVLSDAMTALHEVPIYRELTSGLSQDQRREAMAQIERAYEGFVRPGGACAFPMESLVVAGAAP